jgi:CBS domain-containing protein
MHARDIMTKTVVSVKPTVAIQLAAHTLTQRGFTALPVVNEAGDLVGIVTEADLIRDRFPADPSTPSGLTVGDVMTSPVVGIDHDADVTVIARAMLTAQRRCLPIVDGSTLVGIVTRRDIVRSLARPDADIAVEVRRRLQVLGATGCGLLVLTLPVGSVITGVAVLAVGVAYRLWRQQSSHHSHRHQ